MALDYTTIDRVLQIEPALGSTTVITSADLFVFATDAEAEVNAAIVRSYEAPVSGSPPALVAIATDLAIYRVLSRRVFTQERLKNSGWPDRFKESRAWLKRLADGEDILVDTSGTIIASRTDVAEVASNADAFLPTFTELDPTRNVIDPDKVDELATERLK